MLGKRRRSQSVTHEWPNTKDGVNGKRAPIILGVSQNRKCEEGGPNENIFCQQDTDPKMCELLETRRVNPSNIVIEGSFKDSLNTMISYILIHMMREIEMVNCGNRNDTTRSKPQIDQPRKFDSHLSTPRIP